MAIKHVIPLVIVLTSLLFPHTTALEFFYTIMRDTQQCFEEHLAASTLATGSLSFPKSGNLILSVLNPTGQIILNKVCDNTKPNKFYFTTTGAGRYSICVINEGTEYVEFKLKLERGTEASSGEAQYLASKDEIKTVEDRLNITLELTQGVHRNMNDLRKTGGDQQLLSESTTTTVIILGCVSLAVVIGSVAVQVWYLRGFFRQKKIL